MILRVRFLRGNISLRILLFQALYWITSVFFGLTAILCLLMPSRKPIMSWLKIYSKTILFWMRFILGIKLEVKGKHHVPERGCIIASKHQSWGDGFSLFSQFDDLAFVTGEHITKIPGVGHILKKMDVIVVAQCGGPASRAALIDSEMERARREDRKIFIYPEGRLTEVGYYAPYKKGVFHMYEAYQCPVIPVSTNMGLCWPMDDWKRLKSGTVTLQFHEPIPPGLNKESFMRRLENTIETGALSLLPAGFVVPENRQVETQWVA